MVAGGDALGHLPDGRVVFLRGAIAGERVTVDIVASKRDYARGVVVDVVEASPHRVAPPCPAVALGCGGCGWQHVAPDEQLRLKAAIVTEALRRTGGIADPRVRTVGAVAPWEYRTTLRVAVGPDGRVGLRAAASHRVVTAGECAVCHPSIASLLGPLRVHGADEVTLRVGLASGERTAWADRDSAAYEGLPDEVAVGPTAMVHERVAGQVLRVSAASFFQSGPAAADLLVATVRDACGDALDAGHLLDAYGGVGLFAATLGAARVELVESSEAACADAVANLAGLDAHVTCASFEHWTPVPVPLVVADPARAGLGPAAVDRIAATGAQRLVLVSCDPVSLARDTTLLAAQGFAPVESLVLDLFPQTPHVEVVTRFDRTPAGGENPPRPPAP